MRDDHRLRARSQLRDEDKLCDDHKLRVRSQIAGVDPNRSKFVIGSMSSIRNRCHNYNLAKK